MRDSGIDVHGKSITLQARYITTPSNYTRLRASYYLQGPAVRSLTPMRLIPLKRFQTSEDAMPLASISSQSATSHKFVHDHVMR